jgi:hypothetical protein
MAMMAITTRSSISVKPERRAFMEGGIRGALDSVRLR